MFAVLYQVTGEGWELLDIYKKKEYAVAAAKAVRAEKPDAVVCIFEMIDG